MDILKQSVATGVPMTELMQQTQVAETPEQQQEGLRNQPEGTTMAFPKSTGNFNTVGMDYPINIQKVSPQGDLVRSYENVPPGVENLPMGDDVGTVIETPADYQDGGFDAWKEALPSNLRDTDTTTYNLRGAYEAGLTPTIAPDGKYHLQSVNPKTLEFLKASDHKSTKEEIAWFENQKNTKPLMGTPHPSTHKIVKDPSGYFGERSLKYVKKQEGDFKYNPHDELAMPSDNTAVHTKISPLNAPIGVSRSRISDQIEEFLDENLPSRQPPPMTDEEARQSHINYLKNTAAQGQEWAAIELSGMGESFTLPGADASHLTLEAIFPYAKTLKAAKWGMTPKTVAFTKEGVRKIPKSQVTRLNRVEDANITSKTFNKYEDGNWFLNQPDEFYVNLAKRNPNIKGSTTLASDEAKRLITANVDKELANALNVSKSTDRAKTLSGGVGNKYVDTEYILPPEIVKSMRSTGSGPGYSTHIGDSKAIMEHMTKFYKQKGDFKEEEIVDFGMLPEVTVTAKDPHRNKYSNSPLSKVRKNWAENLNPLGYGLDFKNTVNTMVQTGLGNEDPRVIANQELFGGKDFYGGVRGSAEKGKPWAKERVDLLNMLMGESQKYGSIPVSDYQIEGDPTTYYTSPVTEKMIKEALQDPSFGTKEEWKKYYDESGGKPAPIQHHYIDRSRVLGRYNTTLGEDDKGMYIGYSDTWDLNPLRDIEALNKKFGEPAVDKVMTNAGKKVFGFTPPKTRGRVYFQDGDFQEENPAYLEAVKAAENKEDFGRPSKSWWPSPGTEPSSFYGKVLSYLPTLVKKGVEKAQPYIEKAFEASGPNQVYKMIDNLAGGTYDGSFKFPGGMPICYGNTCVQSTSEILQRTGQWQGKLEQDNDAFAKNYKNHGYEIVQEENALPGDIVQFYKGTHDNRDYSHMGIHGKDNQYFNDGYFDKPWHKKNEPTTTELMENSKNPLNDKAIGKIYYRWAGK